MLRLTHRNLAQEPKADLHARLEAARAPSKRRTYRKGEFLTVLAAVL